MLHTRITKIAACVTAASTIFCTTAFAANVTANTDVNVRSGPDNGSAVVTVMRKGVTAEQLGTSGNWVKVTVNNKTGYVYKRYLNDVKSDSDKDKDTAQTKTVTITADTLNVRAGAGKNTKVLGTLKKGKTATVVATSGDWYKIKYGNGYGYISKKYAKDAAATTTKPTETAQTKTVTITAGSLNVRAGAGKNTKILGVLKKGKTATVVATSGDWYKIKYGNGYGYISKKYAKDAAATTTKPTETTQTKTVTITADSLNIRSGPGKDTKIIGVLKKGETATVIGEPTGKWYKIDCGNDYGYISNRYTKDVTKKVTITADSLNVRSGPGKTYKSLGILKKGNTATVVATSGEWYKIDYNKGVGYISRKYTK